MKVSHPTSALTDLRIPKPKRSFVNNGMFQVRNLGASTDYRLLTTQPNTVVERSSPSRNLDVHPRKKKKKKKPRRKKVQ